MDCVFCRIVKGEIPCTKVYEDDEFVAFRDIIPQAPVHIVLVPKRHIPDMSGLDVLPEVAVGLSRAIYLTATRVGLRDYRLVSNNGTGAGQTVLHFHFHILGGWEQPPNIT